MKKEITLFFALVCSLSIWAQEKKNDKKLYLGITTLPTFGWVSAETNQVSGSGLKPGFAIGVMGDYFFAENYAFSTELLHSTQGFKIKANSISYTSIGDTLPNIQNDVNINYTIRSFQIPLTIKLRTNEIGYWRYYGQVGLAPSFAYRAIRAEFSKDIFPNESDNKNRDVNDKSNDFDYNRPGGTQLTGQDLKKFLEEDNILGMRLPVMISGGAEWNLSGNTSLLFGLRYEYGLLNMMKAADAIARRNVLSLSAGIKF